jgi:hypothetical protein
MNVGDLLLVLMNMRIVVFSVLVLCTQVNIMLLMLL